MKVRIAGVVTDSIVDGPGLRLAVFFQGCPHHCPGCHNPHTHDPRGGYEADTDEILDNIRQPSLMTGITLTGGDPFCQPGPFLELAVRAKALVKDVWAYSGSTFEQLLADPGSSILLRYCDVLVDGPYIQEQRSLELAYRGSRNQRIIDVQASLATGEVVLWKEKKWLST